MEGLSLPQGGGKTAEKPADSPAADVNTDGKYEQENAVPNVMASVLERHERISNRVRNKPQ